MKQLKHLIDSFVVKRKVKFLTGSKKDIQIRADIGIRGFQYISIGDGFYAGEGCRIEAWDYCLGDNFSPEIIIGNRVKINSHCHIGCINKITIGDDVLVGSYVMIIDHSHGTNSKIDISMPPNLRKLFSKGGVAIGKCCWIGEKAIILPGVTLGDNCIVGAGAVVTHSFPTNSVIGGNPAILIKTIS